jgi:hypothetical protein
MKNPAFFPHAREFLDSKLRNKPGEPETAKLAALDDQKQTTQSVMAGVGTAGLLFTFTDFSLASSLAIAAVSVVVLNELRPTLVNKYADNLLGAGAGALLAHNLRVSEAMQAVVAAGGAFIGPRLVAAL